MALLKPRASSDEDREKINAEWFMDNMTSEDIGPLLYFLRKGHPMPADELEAMGLGTFEDLEAENPNAEL